MTAVFLIIHLNTEIKRYYEREDFEKIATGYKGNKIMEAAKKLVWKRRLN